TLARVNAESVVDALGLSHVKPVRRLLVTLLQMQTRPFAQTLAAFDFEVGRSGLRAGSAWLLDRFIGRLELRGQEHIPAVGPVLLLANHPGLSDTLALFASIPRDDLRVLAADKPFLRALPRTSERLIYLPDRPEQRLQSLRKVSTHVREGGAILTFPAGAIEPDPAIRLDASLSLDGWEESVHVLSRIARDVPMVPVIVRGVLSPRAQRHPLTWLRRRQTDREWLGATLQMLWRGYQDVTVQVAIGPPVRSFAQGGALDPRCLITAARQLMAPQAASAASD
ncbi:MAG: 1-acyl-sn-glycerol-3-phosphate acyltransferase, partial [Chloroflexota bacterium]